MKEPICQRCGETEADHHVFTPIRMPAGCQCDPMSWGNENAVKAICADYHGDRRENCLECEHDLECHSGAGR